MDYDTLRKEIIKEAEVHARLLVTGNSIAEEAQRIKSSFKLSGFWGTMSLLFKKTYPPNYFAAGGVLLDSYTASLSASILSFHFSGGLQGNMMMFLEETERVEAMRKKYMGHDKPERIEKAAQVIARCLCLMGHKSSARDTFLHMVSPGMKAKVKAALFALDEEVASELTQ